MSNVLQQIAALHREKRAKLDETRIEKKKILARKQAYFKDSGIPEMWEAVKDIKVVNPAPQVIEGFSVQLKDLFIAEDIEVLRNAGISLYGKEEQEHTWYVALDDLKDTPVYMCMGGPRNLSFKADQPDAKKKFQESFVRFLSRLITPQILLDLDIDLSAPAPEKKVTRKFLQVATNE